MGLCSQEQLCYAVLVDGFFSFFVSFPMNSGERGRKILWSLAPATDQRSIGVTSSYGTVTIEQLPS